MNKKTKSVNLHLSGGLGNQLFQYAFAKNLSIQNNSNLRIDTYTGFFLDKTYKRKFQLNQFAIKFDRISLFAFLKFLLLKFNQRFFKSKQEKVISNYIGNFLFEIDYEPININLLNQYRNLWVIGYWQNPNYFNSIKQLILKELTPPASTSNTFIKLATNIDQTNSVAIGVRLYEETSNPQDLSNSGDVKTIANLNSVIEKLNITLENPSYYIFCSHKPKLLDNLIISKNAVFVTPETGFEDAVDTLWLLSKCKHHVFMNSTFYWWGAYLSANNHNVETQEIYAADNFLNQHIYLTNWKKF